MLPFLFGLVIGLIAGGMLIHADYKRWAVKGYAPKVIENKLVWIKE